MQGMRVQSLVQGDPTCLGATKPEHSCNYISPSRGREMPLESTCLEPVLCNQRRHCVEKPARLSKEQHPLATIKKARKDDPTQPVN